MKFDKKLIIRIVGSAILLMLVLKAVGVDDVLKVLGAIDIWVYIASFLVYLINKLIASYRWKILLEVQNINVSLIALYKVNLLGLVFNSILPSTIGGESVRIYWLMREYPQNKTASIVATLTDKLLGVIALIFLVFIALPFNALIDQQIRITGMLILGAFLLILVIIIWSPGSGLPNLLRRIMFTEWLKKNFDEIINVLVKYGKARSSLLVAFLIAVIFQSISVGNQYLRFQAIGVEVSPLFLFLAIPITTLILTIPISIGGLGLREFSLTRLLAVVGIGDYEVVAYTLVGYSVILILSIILAATNLFGDLLHSRNS